MQFFLATQMGGTPFTNIQTKKILEEAGFKDTLTAKDAEIIVAHNHKHLLRYLLQYPKKKFLVWTNEPRYEATQKMELHFPVGLPKIRIMNVYGSDVFWNNLHFLSSYHFDNSNNLGIDINKPLSHISSAEFSKSNKINKIAALYTNTLQNKTQLIIDNKNVDLLKKRCQYAMEGKKRNLLDIFGNKWPNGFALANSGYGFDSDVPWWIDKIRILNNYKFNLCFENTAFRYYVTEKIWHSITALCLPIYNGFNSKIYESFPKNSFIDASLFEDTHSLLSYVEAISDNEYLERLNLCIDTYNDSLELKRANYQSHTLEVVNKIIFRITN